MKKLILITLGIFLFNLSNAQEIRIAENEIDEFDGTRKIGTEYNAGKYLKLKDYIDVDGTLLIAAYYYKTKEGNEMYSISIVTKAKYLGCLSEYDGKCILLFEDGETLELAQISETQCGDFLYAIYEFYSRDQINDPALRDIALKNYEKISTTLVKKLRIFGTESTEDYTLKDDKKDIIIRHLKAINELK